MRIAVQFDATSTIEMCSAKKKQLSCSWWTSRSE